MNLGVLLDEPSFWTIVAFVLFVVWTERKALLSFFFRRAQIREQQHAAEFDLDQEAKRKLVQADEYSKTLVGRLVEALERQQAVYQEMLNTERVERRTATDVLIEQVRTTERVTSHSVEIAQEFADIARRMVDRMDAVVRVAQTMEESAADMARLLELLGWPLVRLNMSLKQSDGATPEQVLETVKDGLKKQRGTED